MTLLRHNLNSTSHKFFTKNFLSLLLKELKIMLLLSRILKIVRHTFKKTLDIC